MKKTTHRAYTLIELVVFLGLLAGIGALTIPQISSLNEGTKEITRQVVLSKLESAKNNFDSTANTQKRSSFDSASDESRFETLAPLMGAEDPVSFVRGSGIGRLKINKLGENVEVE